MKRKTSIFPSASQRFLLLLEVHGIKWHCCREALPTTNNRRRRRLRAWGISLSGSGFTKWIRSGNLIASWMKKTAQWSQILMFQGEFAADAGGRDLSFAVNDFSERFLDLSNFIASISKPFEATARALPQDQGPS